MDVKVKPLVWVGGEIKAATRADAYLANLYMAGFYPPAIQNWYLRGPATGKRLQWINGMDAVGMGAKECK